MKSKIWKGIYGLTALTGILSSIWGYETYLLTFVDLTLLVVVALVPTIILFLLIRSHYSQLYKTDKNYFPFLQSSFSIGLLTISAFLIINFYLTSSEHVIEYYNIEETGELGGRHHKPYVIIRKDDSTKKLIFKQNPVIRATDKIKVTTKEGLFGFEIIVRQEIVH